MLARERISSYKLSSYLEQTEGLKGVNTQTLLLISTYACSMGQYNILITLNRIKAATRIYDILGVICKEFQITSQEVGSNVQTLLGPEKSIICEA